MNCSQITVKLQSNAGRFLAKFRRLMTPLVGSISRVRIKEQNEHHRGSKGKNLMQKLTLLTPLYAHVVLPC